MIVKAKELANVTTTAATEYIQDSGLDDLAAQALEEAKEASEVAASKARDLVAQGLRAAAEAVDIEEDGSA